MYIVAWIVRIFVCDPWQEKQTEEYFSVKAKKRQNMLIIVSFAALALRHLTNNIQSAWSHTLFHLFAFLNLNSILTNF